MVASNIPDYIKKIKLDKVVENINSSVIDKCFSFSDKDELIMEDNKSRSIFSKSDENIGFKIINPQTKNFTLLKIDNVLLKGLKGGQCDCAVVDNEYFLFIELKLNASSLSNKIYNTNKGQNQIVNTYNYLKDEFYKENVLLMQCRKIQAFICFNNRFPRLSASDMSLSVEFENKNKFPLYIRI